MDARALLNSNVEELEEKLQILRYKLGPKEYEEIRKEIDEIRRLGGDLPDSGYMASVDGIIKKIVDLEFDNFSPKSLKETMKEIKREGFLSRLEYIKLCVGEGKDVSQIFSVAGQYWNAIKENFGAFGIAEVEKKLDEIKLEILLKKVQDTKEVDLNEIGEINYLLIREKLQNILSDEELSKANKLLIKSWLGESIDVVTGKVDAEFMATLLKEKKLWEILTGEKDLEVKNTQPPEEQRTQQPENLYLPTIFEESEERKQQIIKLSEKYNIPLRKFNFSKKKYRYAMYIEKYERFGEVKYRLIGENEAIELKNVSCQNRKVVAVIFNNFLSEIRSPEAYRVGVTTPNGWGHSIQPSLVDVVFPDNVQSIGNRAFYDSGLEEVTIPKTVKVIGKMAFAESSSLQKVSLQEGLETIQQAAFRNCGIVEIDIPSSVQAVEGGAFWQTPLEKVKFANGIVKIGSSAFGETKLKEVELPGSIEILEDEAFKNSPLEKVIFNTGLKVIGDEAFEGCKLQEVEFPETLEKVGKFAFAFNPLKKVGFNTDLKSISESAFFECDELISDKLDLHDEFEKIDKTEDSFPVPIQQEPSDDEDAISKISELIEEVERLSKENSMLMEENSKLKERISAFETILKGYVNKDKSISR